MSKNFNSKLKYIFYVVGGFFLIGLFTDFLNINLVGGRFEIQNHKTDYDITLFVIG